MRHAITLRELLAIRRKHSAALRKLEGYLGSAVGYKWREQDGCFDRDAAGAPIPAVLIFVAKKKNAATVAPDQLVSPRLTTPDGLFCATDVIVGRLPDITPSDPALSVENKRILKSLHEGACGVVGGMAVRTKSLVGTAACVVRHKVTKRLGILTNWHVCGEKGTRVSSNISGLISLGVTREAIRTAPKTPHDLDDLETFATVKHRLDCGYIELTPEAAQLAREGVHGLPALGSAYRLNLDSLEVLGKKVLGLGQTRGLAHGTIIAYGYEWMHDEVPGAQFATNYLIMGEAKQPFAGPGDSGKLVLTDDGLYRPIALLWGGERQQFWGTGKAQDSWAYASDLNQALEHLDVEIHSAPSSGANPPAP